MAKRKKAPAFKLPKNKCVKRYHRESFFAKGSLRTIKRGKVFLIVGCPKGKWNTKTKRCRIGTKAFELIKAAKKGRCPRGEIHMGSF
jgi:hypothetical protein